MRVTFMLLLFSVLAHGATFSTDGQPAIETRIVADGRTIADFAGPGTFYEQNNVDPGITPEGDYMDRVVFTKDGSKAIVSNRMTGNITVFDWTTMAAETTVDVGSYPAGMGVTDSLLVVARPFADSVTVLRLSDWAVVARLGSGVQPWVVRISPDQTRAYVGCDISNTCEVYDLTTLTHLRTLADFPEYLSVVSWNSENGRFAATFNEFLITPDGSHIVIADTAPQLVWIDVVTGAKDDTLAGMGDCWFEQYSGDSTIIVTANYATPAVAYQIDAATRAVTDSVVITGYSLMTLDVAVNADGTKAFFGTSNNTSTLVKFATHDFVNFTQTYTAFWIGVSPDHSKAISGQYNFSIIDFASEEVTGQHSGNSQSYGAVSPIGNRAVGFDPMRNEALYFYDYTNPTPTYRGQTPSGKAPEGDAPHRVAISPDGSHAICTNVLSPNLSVINTGTMEVETILPLCVRPQDIAFTSDSRWAVVAGLGGNTVGIADLSDNSMTTVAVGTGPATVAITPNDSFAYIGNISSNTVSVVQLDGAASQVVATIPVGEIGIVWGAYGVWSGLGMSPTGDYCLVAVSFDDVVRVIDVATNTVVDTLAVGDFPLCIAFDSSGDYATVTNYMAGSYTVMHIDGANSSVVGTFPAGQYAMRLAYDRDHDEMAIGNYGAKTVTVANARTGAFVRTISYTSYGALTDVAFDAVGQPIVLTGSVGNSLGMVHHSSEHVELPAVPAQFDCRPEHASIAVAGPGPDFVSIITYPMGQMEMRTPRVRHLTLDATPNPCRTRTAISLQPTANSPSRMTLSDVSGRVVRAQSVRGSSFIIETSSLSAGVYFVEVEFGSSCDRIPVTVVR